MFRCWMMRKNLLEYCYKELSEKKADKIRKHLSICSKCQRKYEDTQNLIRILSNKEIKKLPEDFWEEYKEDLMEKWDKTQQEKVAPIHIPNTAFNTEISLQLKLAGAMFVLVIALITTGIFVNKKQLSTEQMLSEYTILEELGVNVAFIWDDNKPVESLVKDIEFWEQTTDSETLIRQSSNKTGYFPV
ncbi:hypothetical protein KKC91_00810 [bacterium]|nr:hypothetical protein [bacterium]